MTWKLSQVRADNLVEVRSKEEILATLNQHGCLDGLPFMPEMLQYCGRRFRVSAVAHKACDMVGQRGTSRRLNTTVHLAGLRCDGLAHGGCQAECNLFWKDAWLKRVEDNAPVPGRPTALMNASGEGCTEPQLFANTQRASQSETNQTRYCCQATQLYEASQPLVWWDLRQYVFDVSTGNHSASRVTRVLFLASLRSLLSKVPFGYRFFRFINDWMHQGLTGRPTPSLQARVPEGVPTPTGKLDLKPGEFVRIKPQVEIENTLHKDGKNRGLTFDPEEMAPYCGRVFKVRKQVTTIIEEHTGRMLRMKQPCIMLDGVVCKAEYASCRLNCPRAIPSYWREIWLERAENNSGSFAERTA